MNYRFFACLFAILPSFMWWSCSRNDTLTLKNHFGDKYFIVMVNSDTVLAKTLKEQVIDHGGPSYIIPHCSGESRKVLVKDQNGQILKERILACPSDNVIITFLPERKVLYDSVELGRFTVPPPNLRIDIVNQQ